MFFTVVIAAVVVSAIAAVDGKAATRQLFESRANCVDTWVPPTNLCLNLQPGQIHVPHPTDNTKFIQCGPNGRVFIVKCPTGEIFDITTSDCALSTSHTTSLQSNNPCTVAMLAKGIFYFAFPGDTNKFIQCDPTGVAIEESCPNAQIWTEKVLSCTLVLSPAGSAGHVPQTTVPVASGSIPNPCPQQVSGDVSPYFSHPDPTKFIQCDLVGDAYVQECPARLVWNQYSENCAYVFNTVGVVG